MAIISLPTARYLAPAAFLYDFAAQNYGILSDPNMKTIHDRNLSYFSPQPLFIAAFFFPQQLFQLAWLYNLWRKNPQHPKEKSELEEMLKYVPAYVVGNVCIGTWMFFWNAEMLKVADVFVVINTVVQVWYVFSQLETMDRGSWSSILTHVVAKTFAGIGVLDILHNTSVAFAKNALPSEAVKVATGLGFGALSACSDWILGGCMVYDLVALSVGQRTYEQDWSRVLGGFAVGSAAIVALKNWLR